MSDDASSDLKLNQNLLASHRVWLEDGIIYAEYSNSISTEDILDAIRLAVEQLDQAKIQICPCIAFLNNINKSNFNIKLAEYGKILNAYGFSKRINGIWAVNIPEDVKNHVIPMITAFFGKHFYFVDTLEQAKTEASKYISVSDSFFE